MTSVLFVLALLSACGPARIPNGINDPYEEQNRAVHRDNVALDKALVRPAADIYGTGVPQPLRRGIGRVASNLDTPRMAVDSLLQGRLEDAVHSSFRFLVNSTIGIGGLFDPATEMGLEERNTDFCATLHVWGVGEGAYTELPLIGPSTDRDTAGMVVDLFLNPLAAVLPTPEKHIGKVVRPLAKLDDRYTYGDTVDSVLYDSADSYAQTRTIYLQHRRFELRKLAGGSDEGYIDPYAEGEAADLADPYAVDSDFADPYEDLPQ